MTTEAALPTLSELAAAAKAAVRAAQNSIDEELVRRGEEERQEREAEKLLMHALHKQRGREKARDDLMGGGSDGDGDGDFVE